MPLETDGDEGPCFEGDFVVYDPLSCRYQVDYRTEVALQRVLRRRRRSHCRNAGKVELICFDFLVR